MVFPFYYRPLIPLFFATVIGIAAGSLLPQNVFIHYCFGIIGLLCLLKVLFGIVRKTPLIVSPLILMVSLSALSLQPWLVPEFPENHVIHFAGDKRHEIGGRISETMPIMQKGRLNRFYLDTESIRFKGKKQTITGRLRVSLYGQGIELGPGDRIRFSGKIRNVRNFNNPGGFDYERYMIFQQIWVTSHTPKNRFKIIEKNPSPPIITSFRNSISKIIDKSSSYESGGVLKALILGDRGDIAPPVKESFTRTGVSHLLAISGLHMGIVGACAFWLFNRLFSQFTVFLYRGWTFKAAALCSIFPVLGYGLLASMSPSTQRATIMVAIFLLSFFVQRDKEPFNTLCIAGLVILVVHPPSLFKISFQLSFLSVSAILFGFSVFDNHPWLEKGFGKWFFSAVLVSLFAVLGTLPVVLQNFNRFSLIGIPVNLIMVPIVGFLVVPAGLLSTVSIFLSPKICETGMALCTWILDNAIALLTVFSDLSWASIYTVTPSHFEIFLYYATLGTILWFFKNRKITRNTGKQKPPLKQKQLVNFNIEKSSPENKPLQNFVIFSRFRGIFVKKYDVAKAALIVLCFAWLLDIGYWIHYRLGHNDLRISVIDVGQGSASLLELPKGVNVLIDGGGFPDNSIFDVGKNIVGPFLRRKKISTIDIIILSHPNSDHLNGLLHIAENFHVKQVWSNNEASMSRSYKNFIEIIRKNHINTPSLEKLQGPHEIAGATVEVCYPPSDFLETANTLRWRNTNNNSMVIQVRYGDIGFLFPGDLMAEAEKELTDLFGKHLKSSVLLVPHHGSSTSCTEVFLDAVNPSVAVISAGWRNRFSFPHTDVLNRLCRKKCSIYQTSFHGAVQMETDGRKLTIIPTIQSGFSKALVGG